MTDSEKYWLALIDELHAATAPLRGDGPIPSKVPPWVDKLTFEVLNMITPKLQLRPGIKPTADKIGVMIGSHLIHIAQGKSMAAIPMPTAPEARAAMERGIRLATPPEGMVPIKVGMSKLPEIERKVHAVIGRVLSDRPLDEAAEFFKGLSRGLRQNARSIIPDSVCGRPQFSPKQFELLRRLIVYTVARHNWRELDVLKTSQEAFHWFERRIPAEILGNDPERIRKMFYRVGKRFKDPGRPKKGTRSV
jgi:hypothetical protein